MTSIVEPCCFFELSFVEKLPQGPVVVIRPKVQVLALIPGIYPVEREIGWSAVAPYHGAKGAVAKQKFLFPLQWRILVDHAVLLIGELLRPADFRALPRSNREFAWSFFYSGTSDMQATSLGPIFTTSQVVSSAVLVSDRGAIPQIDVLGA